MSEGDHRHVHRGNRDRAVHVRPTMHRRRSPLAFLPLALLPLALTACGSDDVATEGTGTRDETTTTTPATTGGGTDGEVDDGVEVSGAGYHGWIIDPDADEGWMFDDTADPVWATEDDVARVEAILSEQIPERHDAATNEYEREHLGEVASTLDEYERQYVGAHVEGTGDDAQVVYVNALCTTDVGGDPDRMGTGVVMVMDGGACFWNATVDLGTGEIVSMSVNGDA